MPLIEHELIKQIKVAEQRAEQIQKDAETESALVIEKAQSDRIRRLEHAKTEAREILKKKVEEAKDTSNYIKLIKDSEKSSEILLEKIRPKINEAADLVANHILEIG
ncbi:MAG: hypothetical protein ACTSQ4_00855 [Candidatus Heimdallarchaeaceae archaeon]